MDGRISDEEIGELNMTMLVKRTNQFKREMAFWKLGRLGVDPISSF
jgi:hypothetical protein